MKNVLIPTDFSIHSKYTILHVLDLMQGSPVPGRILLLNTYLLPLTAVHEVIAVNDSLKKRSQEGLASEVQLAQKNLKNNNILIETTSHIGSLKSVIIQLIKCEKFDFVAMGKDEGKHIELISRLLQKEKCPLIVTQYSEMTGTYTP